MKYDLSYLELELRELLKKLKKHNTYAMQLENEITLYALENARLKEENYKLQKCLNEEELDVQDQNRELCIRIDKAIEYIEKQKPLSVDETRQKEQLKLAYKNSDIFKTICHLEDLEIAIWELKNILKGVDKE